VINSVTYYLYSLNLNSYINNYLINNNNNVEYYIKIFRLTCWDNEYDFDENSITGPSIAQTYYIYMSQEKNNVNNVKAYIKLNNVNLGISSIGFWDKKMTLGNISFNEILFYSRKANISIYNIIEPLI